MIHLEINNFFDPIFKSRSIILKQTNKYIPIQNHNKNKNKTNEDKKKKVPNEEHLLTPSRVTTAVRMKTNGKKKARMRIV
jgi:hypothetical protein